MFKIISAEIEVSESPIKIIKIKKFNSYLEIGCDDDYSFKRINVPEKIGVDPYSGGNFKGTSDEFFLQNSKKNIDGLQRKLLQFLRKKLVVCCFNLTCFVLFSISIFLC